jgi:hypothetical protein
LGRVSLAGRGIILFRPAIIAAIATITVQILVVILAVQLMYLHLLQKTKKTHNHAHIQSSRNSRVSLNIDSEVRADQGDQEADVESASNVRMRQSDPNNDLLNTELLASLIPLLNKLVRDELQ